jgi:hypothetical protein
MLVGVISDTHGSVPEGLEAAFAGVERIIHAGDVGAERVLAELEAIAPVVAVHGNMDSGDLGWRLPDRAVVKLDGRRVVVVHDEAAFTADAFEGAAVIVSGHTHVPLVERRGSVLRLNPGAAVGSERYGLRPTVAVLDLAADPPEARIIEL